MPSPTHSSPMLRVQMLGVLQVTLACDPPSRVLSIPPGPVAHLLCYLALYAPAFIPRSRLAGLLHPDLPESSARRALSDALYRLRRELGPAASRLQADADSVSLCADALWLDVQEFRAKVASSRISDWQQALDLYLGDLLEDQDAEWMLAQRAQLHEDYVALHERVYRALMEDRRWAEALTYAHRWTLADPLSEQAQQAAIRLYARLGRPAAALEQYEHFVRLLVDELNATPLAETQALAQAIRGEYEAAVQKSQPQSPFVGRRRERARLLDAADRALEGVGGLAVVEGEPGVGKTRLLEKFAEGAAWRGLKVVWGHALEYSASAPFAPLGEALTAALAGPRVDQVRQALGPAIAQAAAFLVPRLHTGPLLKSTGQPDLTTAVTQILQALARLAPHVLIFDDVQWADQNFWPILRDIAPRLSSSRLLIVLSYRGEELRARRREWEHLRKLDSEHPIVRVVLEGLSVDECRELARASQPMLDEQALHSLLGRTGGNPLYLSEALEQADHTSPSFHHLVERRWNALIPPARAALQAASVLGSNLVHGVWQAVAGLDLLDQIPLLVSTRFIVETAQGYAFQHDLTREYVYEGLELEHRRELHRRAGEALAREARHADPAVLAWHFEQAEDLRQAIHHLREAGAGAEKRSGYYAALDYFGRALVLAERLDDSALEKLAILSRLPHVARACGKIPEWQQATRMLEEMARSVADQEALLTALESQVELSAFALDWETMQNAAAEAIGLAQKVGNAEAEVRLRNELGFQLCDALGRVEDARAHLEQALELSKRLGHREQMIRAYGNLALVNRLAGNCAAARTANAEMLRLLEDDQTHRGMRAEALNTSGLIHTQLGNWEMARRQLLDAVQLGQDLGDMSLLGPAVFDLATASMRMGQHAQARHWVDYYLRKYKELGGDPDLLLGRWVRSLSGNAHVLAGEFHEAHCVFDELISWIEAETAGRQLLLALNGLGQLALEENNPREAQRHLSRAVEIWKGMRGSEINPLLLHAIAATRCGDRQAAQISFRLAEEVLQATDVAQYNVLWHYARFELSGQFQDLEAAHAEIERQASGFEDTQLRSDFLTQVRLHDRIEQLWRERHPASQPQVVLLARADAPLGKKLGEVERVPVYWTVDAGEVDAQVLRRDGKVALRRYRLHRLLQEARAAGALPTDDDLALALGVDRRTILRDMAWLAANGQTVATRRRRNGNGHGNG